LEGLFLIDGTIGRVGGLLGQQRRFLVLHGHGDGSFQRMGGRAPTESVKYNRGGKEAGSPRRERWQGKLGAFKGGLMKTLGGATLVGVLVALAVIYWLSPLNGGAVALVLVLCASAANLVAGAVVVVRKRAEGPGKPARKKKRGHGPKVLLLALLLV